MAKGKKKGGKRGRDWIQTAFNVLGALVAAAPAIQAFQDTKSDLSQFPTRATYLYIGLDTRSGQWSQSQAIAGLGTVAAGGVVAGIPKIFRAVKRLVSGR